MGAKRIGGEFPGGLVVKDLVLSPLWCAKGLIPGLELLQAMGTAKKKKDWDSICNLNILKAYLSKLNKVD